MEYSAVVFGGIAYVSIAVVIIFIFYFIYRKRNLLSEEIRLAIEQGQPFEFPKREVNFYLHGILWTIIGVLVFVSLVLSTGDLGLSILGLLPTAAGVAFLAVHRKAQREEQETHS